MPGKTDFSKAMVAMVQRCLGTLLFKGEAEDSFVKSKIVASSHTFLEDGPVDSHLRAKTIKLKVEEGCRLYRSTRSMPGQDSFT